MEAEHNTTLTDATLKLMREDSTFGRLSLLTPAPVTVHYTFEPAIPAIIRADPNDSEEGQDASLEIDSVIADENFELRGERTHLVIHNGCDIYLMYSEEMLDELKGEIFTSLTKAGAA